MENKTNVIGVNISAKRIPLQYEIDNVDRLLNFSRIIPWEAYEAKALDLIKDNDTFMRFVDASILPKSTNGYSIYMVDKDFPNIEENLDFVQQMMRDSNFAKTDKIKFVLYRINANTPFAVVVENF